MDEKTKQTKTSKVESSISKYKSYRRVVMGVGAVAGTLLGFTIAAYLDTIDKRKQEYNKIFLNESNKLPTKSDSIYFYQKHGLEDYIVYEDPLDTTKTFEEHIKLLDVPYSKMKRIVKEIKK